MGWNGSADKYQQSNVGNPNQQKKKHLIITGIISVSLIVVAVLVTLHICSDDEVDESTCVSKSNVIATPKPTSVTTSLEARVTLQKQARPANVTQDERGVWRYPGGARWPDPDRKVHKRTDNISHIDTLFKHPSERHIAGLLEIEPGTMVYGSLFYPDSLRQDFVNSIADKIEFLDEDTPEDIAIKKAVQETKKEICTRIRNGEDFIEILKSTRDELARLGAYRNELKVEIDKIVRDENYSEQDVKDFEAAANKMLEKEGLPKLVASCMLVRQRILAREKERRDQMERETSAKE